jgi:16S rRNA A1518/A1519 N6-dimethyltransferase RsmA/KsgA/DIM1 with predicted DNA glycosylase/AP lyase activity
VDSVFFHLRRKAESPVARRQIPAVLRTLRALFSHRRKLLKASLRELENAHGPLPEAAWKHAEKRVESLRPDALLDLAATLTPLPTLSLS